MRVGLTAEPGCARARNSISPHGGRRGGLWSAKVGEDVATCRARVSGAEGFRGPGPAVRAGCPRGPWEGSVTSGEMTK